MSYTCKENLKQYKRSRWAIRENYWNGHFEYATRAKVCWNCKGEQCVEVPA